MPGIYITRGMTVSIPSFSIRIRDDGEIEGDPLTLHVRFDVCPTWIRIAKHHLDNALVALANRRRVWTGTDEAAKGLALEAATTGDRPRFLSALSRSPRKNRHK